MTQRNARVVTLTAMMASAVGVTGGGEVAGGDVQRVVSPSSSSPTSCVVCRRAPELRARSRPGLTSAGVTVYVCHDGSARGPTLGRPWPGRGCGWRLGVDRRAGRKTPARPRRRPIDRRDWTSPRLSVCSAASYRDPLGSQLYVVHSLAARRCHQRAARTRPCVAFDPAVSSEPPARQIISGSERASTGVHRAAASGRFPNPAGAHP